MIRTEGYKEVDKSQGQLRVVLGSTNQVKSRAVAEACKKVFLREQILVQEADVRSGVPPQPRDDDTTKQGAMNHALHAATFAHRNYKKLHIILSESRMESWMSQPRPAKCPGREIWECPAWIAVLDAKGR